jgi:hypothetical protein
MLGKVLDVFLLNLMLDLQEIGLQFRIKLLLLGVHYLIIFYGEECSPHRAKRVASAHSR